MTSHAPALVLCFVLGTVIWAYASEAPKQKANSQQLQGQTTNLPFPINWIRDWLKEPIEKAIADAHDPRDRRTTRQ